MRAKVSSSRLGGMKGLDVWISLPKGIFAISGSERGISCVFICFFIRTAGENILSSAYRVIHLVPFLLQHLKHSHFL